MSLIEEQKAKYAGFLYTTLRQVGKICPQVIEKDGSLTLASNWKDLIKCSKTTIETPFSLILEDIYNQPSSLIDEDEFLTSEQIMELFLSLQEKGRLLRLNHIGFTYKPVSVKASIKHICDVSSQNGFQTLELDADHPKEEPIWAFVGDTTNWQDPMLEFIPLQGEITEKEVDYFLPHLHINIDSNLSFENIADSVRSVFKGTRSVHANYYNSYITQARIWVGVVSGINLHLDIATYSQNTRYTRKALLRPLVG